MEYLKGPVKSGASSEVLPNFLSLYIYFLNKAALPLRKGSGVTVVKVSLGKWLWLLVAFGKGGKPPPLPASLKPFLVILKEDLSEMSR